MKRVLITKMAMIAGFLTGQLRAAEAPSEDEHVPGDIGGRFQLGVQTQLAYASASSGTEDDGTSSTERSSNQMGLNVGASGLQVVFGYGLHHDWLINAALSAWHSNFDHAAEPRSRTELTGEAALSYLLGQGRVRPYVGAQALVLTTSDRWADHFGAGGGAHAGLRVELAEALSLEPRVAVEYTRTSTHYEVGSLRADLDEQFLSGNVGLRLAGWL